MMNTNSNPGEQNVLWNGAAGCAWVDAEDLIEQVFKPLEVMLTEQVRASSARCVLDIGCGTGITTLAASRALGPDGRCVGIDISAPMIAAARARAERQHSRATFVEDNAETRVFEPDCFDLVISRFGVMFFNDSARAFANLRSAARDGAHLRFIAWRSAEENPFMTTAERAAAPLLPNIPPREPNAPGQFAFADRKRVHRILEEGGWIGIEIKALDVVCGFPEKELVRYFTRFGPLGRVFEQAEEQTRAEIINTVRRAFEPYVQGSQVRFTAACWDVSARASKSSRGGGDA